MSTVRAPTALFDHYLLTNGAMGVALWLTGTVTLASPNPTLVRLKMLPSVVNIKAGSGGPTVKRPAFHKFSSLQLLVN